MLSSLTAAGPRAVSLAFPKERYRLHAMVTSAGYDLRRSDQRGSRGYDWNGLRRGEASFVLLQHTISGRGRLRYGSTQHEVRPGQTMLLAFPHDNRYWLAPGDEWEFFWICLNGSEVLRLWRQLLEVGPLARLGTASIGRLARACVSVLDGEASSPARSSQLAYSIAMQLADEMLAWGEVRTRSKRPAAIERAVSLVHDGGGAPVDVGRMAAASGYSRYHFSRMFSATEGVPPARFRLRVRMEEAARRLQTEPDPINVVALRCGFADANYFTKLFRRFYGMTPRDFRRSGMFAGRPAPQAFR